MKLADQHQLVALVEGHSRKLERIETLSVPASGLVHHTFMCYTPSAAVGTIARVRLYPGVGRGYKVLKWFIAANVHGSVVIDVLKSSGYPPVTSMCAANRPNITGDDHDSGTTALWNDTVIAHNSWLIINIFSLATITALGFGLELEPT